MTVSLGRLNRLVVAFLVTKAVVMKALFAFLQAVAFLRRPGGFFSPSESSVNKGGMNWQEEERRRLQASSA